MKWITNNERYYRGIEEDQNGQFLNWKDRQETESEGTSSLVARARDACKELEIALSIVDDVMTIMTGESELNTITAAGIGHFLTQDVIRSRKQKKLIQHDVHGASYPSLKDNEVSNSMLTNIHSRKSDAFFRFMVVGRADCLPTPVNLRRWFNKPREERCPVCGLERQQTLAHILNECKLNFPLMTKRHNKVSDVVRRGVARLLAKDLRSEIHENQPIEVDGLADELRSLRPDMVFEQLNPGDQYTYHGPDGELLHSDKRTIEIVEFSCPYAYFSHGGDTLKRVYEEKKRKYTTLAQEVARLREQRVRITAVIVSSMGAVYEESLRDLQGILRCTNKEIQKLGRRMSEAALMGSMEIYRQSTKRLKENTIEGAEEAITEEVAEFEGVKETIELEDEEAEDQEARDQEEDFEPEEGHEDQTYDRRWGYVGEKRENRMLSTDDGADDEGVGEERGEDHGDGEERGDTTESDSLFRSD
jgi:hypothetical protein